MSIYKGTTNIGSLAVGAKTEVKQVTPSTSSQSLTPSTGYNAIERVEVEAVTASIDPNIQAENIKQGVEILGVTGTMEQGVQITGATITGNSINIAQLLAVDDAFTDARNQLITIDDSDITNIKQAGYTFARCASLEHVRLRSLQSVAANVNYVFAYNHKLKTLQADELLTYNGQSMCTNCEKLEEINFPKATYIGNNWYSVNSPLTSALKKVVFGGTLTNIGALNTGSPLIQLRYFEVGQDTDTAMNFARWTATNVIAEGQTGIDELNYNITTYLADKVADRTNDTALTVTFGASLYNVLTPATIAAFTAKNWSVASA
jgi:hypothetical protein